MTLWTVQSIEFSWPEYWSGQPFSSPGDLPNPGIEPGSPGNLLLFKSVWQSLPFSLFTVNVVIDLVSIRLSMVLFVLVLSFVLWFLFSCFVLD